MCSGARPSETFDKYALRKEIQMRKLIIVGAGGRDFHNFNGAYRDDPGTEVVAFTATQNPGIDVALPRLDRGLGIRGIPVQPESELSS